jgi:hypothetical protein
MPVSLSSRYYGQPVYVATDARGRSRATVAILPTLPAASTPALQQVLTGVETIESLAWQLYGSSAEWWRIADANPRLFPLNVPVGTPVLVPASSALVQHQRPSRSF